MTLRRLHPLLILAGLIAGILVGAVGGQGLSGVLPSAELIGTLWLNALRMTVVPLVMALLVSGIAQTTRLARAGAFTSIAIASMIGLLWLSTAIAALLTPLLLDSFPLADSARAALAASFGQALPVSGVPGFGAFLQTVIPTNPFQAATGDSILPLIVFTLIFAFAVTRLEARPRTLFVELFEAVQGAMLVVIGWVLAIAPIGVFALGLVVGAKGGGAAFGALGHYVLIVSGVGLVVALLAYPLALVIGRVPLLAFVRASLPAQAVAISTQSSLASLPAMVEGTRALGIEPAKIDVVLPIAVAIFRVTSPAMNLAVAIYVAHALGLALSPATIAAGAVVAALTTLGSVSLPGTISYIASIAPIAYAMGVPVAPLGLLVAIETFPDLMRTLGNVTMDMALTSALGRRTRVLGAAEAA